MGCKFNNSNGLCSLFDEDEPWLDLGTDDEGTCICEDDEYPEDSCPNFEEI